ELLRGRALDVELRGEAERAHAVDQPEVHRLDIAALIGADLRRRYAEDLSGRRAMNVGPFVKPFQQRGVLRQVRHDPKLDLRVVGGDERVAGRCDERFAYAPP